MSVCQSCWGIHGPLRTLASCPVAARWSRGRNALRSFGTATSCADHALPTCAMVQAACWSALEPAGSCLVLCVEQNAVCVPGLELMLGQLCGAHLVLATGNALDRVAVVYSVCLSCLGCPAEPTSLHFPLNEVPSQRKGRGRVAQNSHADCVANLTLATYRLSSHQDISKPLRSR